MSIDKAFHNLLCEAADNAYVAERLEQLYDLSLRLWSLVLNPLEAIPYGMERHGRVLAALMEGDEVEAETIVQQHIVGFQENIRAIL
jgi:DNA-binding GntR family transcriptional regulator